jgi:exodeoxyribonuclease VII small subunit
MSEAKAGGGLEAHLARLEAIVDALEQEELELEAALGLFEEGIGHLRDARGILSRTELRVERLLEEADADDGAGHEDDGE